MEITTYVKHLKKQYIAKFKFLENKTRKELFKKKCSLFYRNNHPKSQKMTE